MRYTITKARLGALDLHKGRDVERLAALLRTALPEVAGYSYSFADGTLTVDIEESGGLGERVRTALAAWGEAAMTDGIR